MLAAGRSPAAAEACRIVLGGSLLGFVFAWLLLARGVGRRTISLRSLPCHPEKDATAPLPLCPEKERKEIKEVEDPTAFLLSEPKLRSVIEQRQKRMEQNDLEIQARAEEDRKAKVQQAAEELRKKQAERKAQEKLLKWEKEQLAKREGMSTVAPEVGGTQVHPLVPSVGEAGGTQLHPLVPIPAEAGGNRAYGEHMIAMNPEKEYQREAEKLEKLRLQEVEQRKRLEEQEEQEEREEREQKEKDTLLAAQAREKEEAASRVQATAEQNVVSTRPAKEKCHTAVKGEKCFEHVMWSMRTGIHQRPEWYPGLTSKSSYTAFQLVLNTTGTAHCPKPCSVDQERGPSGGCRTALPGEDCYIQTLWAKNQGIYEHPEWYGSLTKSSSFESFQNYLRTVQHADCPKPCMGNEAILQ